MMSALRATRTFYPQTGGFGLLRSVLWFTQCIVTLCTSLALVAGSTPTHGATLEVKPDGSKEYSVLQDALSAAATGDTVLVHAGVYRNWTERVHGGTARRAVGFIERGVTITTTGLNAILAPPDIVDSMGLYSVTSDSIHISGIRVEGALTSVGIFASMGSGTRIINCQFRGVSWGVLAGGAGNPCIISNCVFSESGGVGALVSGWVLVRDCDFFRTPPTVGSALVVAGPAHGELRSSRVNHLAQVAQANSGGFALVDSVIATNVLLGGLVSDPTSKLVVTNSEIVAADLEGRDTFGLVVETGGVLYARNVRLDGMLRAVTLNRADSATVRDSQILNWGEWGVLVERATDPPRRVFDFTRNSWSETDSASIAAAIWDGVDDPAQSPYGFVEFWPITNNEVSLPRESVGGLKSRY